MSLSLNDNIVLTDLAYEKAKRLGMSLITPKAYTPPAAPVRPYVSKENQPSNFERKRLELPHAASEKKFPFSNDEMKIVNSKNDESKEEQSLGIVQLAKRNLESSRPQPGYPSSIHTSKPDIHKIRKQLMENIQLKYGQIDQAILEKLIDRALSRAGIV